MSKGEDMAGAGRKYTPKTYYVPKLEMKVVNPPQPPALELSVVVVEQFGPFFGHHLYIDGVWLMGSTHNRTIRLLKKLLDAENEQYFGEWLAEHYPECIHPNSMPLSRFGVGVRVMGAGVW